MINSNKTVLLSEKTINANNSNDFHITICQITWTWYSRSGFKTLFILHFMYFFLILNLDWKSTLVWGNCWIQHTPLIQLLQSLLLTRCPVSCVWGAQRVWNLISCRWSESTKFGYEQLHIVAINYFLMCSLENWCGWVSWRRRRSYLL